MRSSTLIALMFLFPFVLWGAESEPPSLELLEFLAEGAMVDGRWTDPVEVDEMTRLQQNTLVDEVERDE